MENVKSFKRKMLLWTSNWSQENYQSIEEIPLYTPDAIEIASLLQTIGFRIRFMDQCSPKEMHPVPGVAADSPACRVILMCPTSGIRMELDAPTSACKCPSPDYTQTGHREQATKAVDDSLVPKASPEISKTVSELIGGLFNVMSLFPDQNHNDMKAAPAFVRAAASPMKTPATGIAVVTPNAPCGPKVSLDETDSKGVIPGRYRSLDTLISSGGLPDDLPEPGQLTPKDDGASGLQETHMEVDIDIGTNFTQGTGSATKKFISKSSPAVNCNEPFQEASSFNFENDNVDDNMQDESSTVRKIIKPRLLRTDTYSITDTLENNSEGNDQPRMDFLRPMIPSTVDRAPISKSSLLLTKLQQIQLHVSDMMLMVANDESNVSNISDVSKASKVVSDVVQRMADRVRPIRCLSDFGSVPNLSRSGGIARSIPRPKTRRYTSMITAAPATPTTSRRRGAAVGDRPKKGSSMVSKITSNRVAPNSGSSLQKISASPSFTASSKDTEPLLNPTLNRKAAINSDAKSQNPQSSCIPKPGSIRK